jgi:type II secretory pathway pseudopilin PulG
MAVQTCGTDVARDVIAALSKPCRVADVFSAQAAQPRQSQQQQQQQQQQPQQQQQCSIDTVLCTKCERQVPTANMALHTARCRGTTCASTSTSSDCSNNSSSKSSSNADPHSASSTSSAHAANSTKTQSSSSSERYNWCACPWCELGFTAADLPKHVDACGARTERYADTAHYTLYV